MKRAAYLSIIVLTLGAFLTSGLVEADIYRYVDKEGKEWYVSSLDSIPRKYRGKAEVVAQNRTEAVKEEPSSAKKVKTLKEQELDKRIKMRMSNRRKLKKLKNVEIYVTSWCPHCKNLENFLQQYRIPYRRYDIERDKAAKERHADISKGGGVPVVKIGDHVIQGNNQKAILQYLNK